MSKILIEFFPIDSLTDKLNDAFKMQINDQRPEDL